MNKSDLVAKVAQNTGVSVSDTEKVVNGVLDSIKNALVADEKVQLVGFGTFEARKRDAREARNPRTGEKVQVAETRVAKFSAGGPLKDALK